MIKDSGERREFETGAVRDMAEGKGRFDLMPLDVLAELMPHDKTVANDGLLSWIADFVKSGEIDKLYCAAFCVIEATGKSPWECALDLAVHFENGAKKYGELNWQRGIEAKSYVDSAVRHYVKFKAGYEDEPHAIACLWNLICCMWTIKNMPELNSYAEKNEKRCTETTCFHNEALICYKREGRPAAGKNCPHFIED